MIYSNTLGISTIRLGSGQLISDDITTTAPVSCNLTQFSFKVVDKVFPADQGGAYTVRYALYDNCPQSVPLAMRSRFVGDPAGGIIIPGTNGEVTFPDDAPRTIEHVIAAPNVVPIPTNLWMGISFTRSNCGAVVGAPAMLGHSADIMDFSGALPCNVSFGGFPEQPHASFWAEMSGGAHCPDSFVAYKAAKASAAQFSAGGNVPFLDDVKLIVNNCQMIGYEVAVRGQGFYQFDLVRDCGAPPPATPNVPAIPGTYKTFIVTLSTQPQLQLARFAFDPPIPLNTEALFFRFIVNNSVGGVVKAGIQPTIGSSSEDFFLVYLSGCDPAFLQLPSTGVFHLSITCAGTRPVGACCDTNGPDFSCTDAAFQADCNDADDVWTENATCANVTCDCIPACFGRVCGDDGCGGSCGQCDDGNACTDDSCDDVTGQCIITNNSSPCDDGNACTTGDSCSVGMCIGAPLNCSDANVCNGTETCDPVLGCRPGIPLNCNDGIFCNGVESSDPQSGCLPGIPPCNPDETCDEDAHDCRLTPIPASSTWGLIVLALTLAVLAKLRFRIRPIRFEI